MCGPSTAIGVATGVTQGMSALGSYQQGRAQTDATNQARQNQYRDQLAMQRYAYNKELGVYNQQVADYRADLKESEIAYEKSITQLGKRASERTGAAAFSEQDAIQKDIQTEGQILASLPAGGSRDRALALARGAAGMRKASVYDNLLRGRFADIDAARSLTDQANSYRRQLFSRVPLAPTMAPTPSAPVMQQGPSALSLVAGLGSAALGGFTAGAGAEAQFKQAKMFGKSV